ncbi:Beta-barrel assembly-enhancing protease [Labrys miyagiensis]
MSQGTRQGVDQVTVTAEPGASPVGHSQHTIDKVIALAEQGRVSEALVMLTPALANAPRNRNLVRRLIVAPAMRGGELDKATAFLERLVEANPASAEDLFTLGSVLMRAGQRKAGHQCMERAGELDPANLAIAAVRLQEAIRTGVDAATLALVRRYADRCDENPRLAQLCLMALGRKNAVEDALKIVERLLSRGEPPADLALEIAQVLSLAHRHEEARRVAADAIARGATAARLHLVVANAMSALGGNDAEIAEHLRTARKSGPNDVLLLRTLGETLLRLKQYEEAADVLARAAALSPELANLQMLLARALKLARRYDEAATVLQALTRNAPASPALQRRTIGALLRAGRKKEAQNTYRALVQESRARLRGSFSDVSAGLYDDLSKAPIPQGRLDFAWNLATRLAKGKDLGDREAWDRSARWGCLADFLLLDWLESVPEKIGEVADLLVGVDEAVAGIRTALAEGRGSLLISPHMGPMYSGPLALRIAGLPTKWLASAPKVASSSYADSLISTSEHSEVEVAREVINALREGYAVVIAIDGVMSPSAPRVEWEGHQVTYSQFAAGLGFRLGIPSFCTIPYWSGERIRFHVRAMPRSDAGEQFASFARRYQDAFFAEIEQQMLRGPENLRLSGGIWRGIR